MSVKKICDKVFAILKYYTYLCLILKNKHYDNITTNQRICY